MIDHSSPRDRQRRCRSLAGSRLVLVAATFLAGACAPTLHPTVIARPAAIPAATAVAAEVPPTTTPTPVTLGYPSAIADVAVDNPAFDGVEREVTTRVTAAGIPGASLLVVQRGALIEQEAWGSYSLDTVVPIASASKWLTAATIMTLVDDGTLDLDAPIATYLPRAAGTVVGPITLRQLLSFTSGLIDHDRLAESSDASISLQDEARAILRGGVVHPPGAAFRYGGQHLTVAAALAEVVTGRPFVELFDERIAEPLGMASTFFVQVGDFRVAPVDHPNPAGSAVSTLGDYGRFLELLVHDGIAPSGDRILSHDSIVEMQTNQTDRATAAGVSATDRPYGLGEWLDWTFPDGTAMVLSSNGKFGFRPWIDHRNDLFGVYLVDNRTARPGVSVSGTWVFELVAEAVGGELPTDRYPHRS